MSPDSLFLHHQNLPLILIHSFLQFFIQMNSYLCSFPNESPTVFFTSSFPGFTTCFFKPVKLKGIFFCFFFFPFFVNSQNRILIPETFLLWQGRKYPLDFFLIVLPFVLLGIDTCSANSPTVVKKVFANFWTCAEEEMGWACRYHMYLSVLKAKQSEFYESLEDPLMS